MSVEDIGYQVSETAEWRRLKAAQFPEDTRNLQAAQALDRLARQIEELEKSEIHSQIDEANDSLAMACEATDNYDVWADINEDVSGELRSIGFHSDNDAVHFLEWYRDLLREKLQDVLDKAVPVPDLHEQVANDPSVKAAKQAYESVYAKALAEARKKV
jgi:hypothetical protein